MDENHKEPTSFEIQKSSGILTKIQQQASIVHESFIAKFHPNENPIRRMSEGKIPHSWIKYSYTILPLSSVSLTLNH